MTEAAAAASMGGTSSTNGSAKYDLTTLCTRAFLEGLAAAAGVCGANKTGLLHAAHKRRPGPWAPDAGSALPLERAMGMPLYRSMDE